MVLPILHSFLALSISSRAGLVSLTQTSFTFSLPRRVGVDGIRGER